MFFFFLSRSFWNVWIKYLCQSSIFLSMRKDKVSRLKMRERERAEELPWGRTKRRTLSSRAWGMRGGVRLAPRVTSEALRQWCGRLCRYISASRRWWKWLRCGRDREDKRRKEGDDRGFTDAAWRTGLTQNKVDHPARAGEIRPRISFISHSGSSAALSTVGVTELIRRGCLRSRKERACRYRRFRVSMSNWDGISKGKQLQRDTLTSIELVVRVYVDYRSR